MSRKREPENFYLWVQSHLFGNALDLSAGTEKTLSRFVSSDRRIVLLQVNCTGNCRKNWQRLSAVAIKTFSWEDWPQRQTVASSVSPNIPGNTV
jgi:hypothetical protein